MRTRRIYLVNPKADSAITRPLYLGRALYSPLAGLLAVAALIPEDRYEVVLTDENVEPVDFDLKADLVGISAQRTSVLSIGACPRPQSGRRQDWRGCPYLSSR